MKRVVITGIGIISPIGNDEITVADSLKNGKSGLQINQEYIENGMRCHVSGPVEADFSNIDRKAMRFMSETAAYSFVATQRAIQDAGLVEQDLQNEATGVIVGSGTGSSRELKRVSEAVAEKGLKKIGPYSVTKTMSNTTSAAISTFFQTKGASYSISSACTTSLHCISHGYDLIRFGKQQTIIAGGSEDVHWTGSIMFDAMGALSTNYNDTPKTASRPYDEGRDGFIPSGGAGIVILEELESAKKRGAKIYGEIIATHETSDGYSLVSPSGDGAVRCMRGLKFDGQLDYINTHGTSTPVGDITELHAIKEAFGADLPLISSTKSLTGHTLGAAGVHEVIYGLIMMKHGFVSGSSNIERLDPEAKGFPIAMESQDKSIDTFMSNSFGFGGTNGSIVIRKV